MVCSNLLRHFPVRRSPAVRNHRCSPMLYVDDESPTNNADSCDPQKVTRAKPRFFDFRRAIDTRRFFERVSIINRVPMSARPPITG